MLFIFIIYRIVLIKNRCIIFQFIWHIDLIKMQFFCFFYINKRSGGLGASPQNKKLLISLKIFSIYLNKYILQFMFLFYSTFSRLTRCGLRQSFRPSDTLREKCKYLSYLSTFSESANISVLYIINIYVK